MLQYITSKITNTSRKKLGGRFNDSIKISEGINKNWIISHHFAKPAKRLNAVASVPQSTANNNGDN